MQNYLIKNSDIMKIINYLSKLDLVQDSPDTNSNSNKEAFFWVFGLLTQRKLLFMGIIAGIMIHQPLRFIIPVLIGKLLDSGVEEKNEEAVKFYALIILITALVSAFFDLVMSWLNEIAANDVELNTRSIYFKSIQGKSMSFHDESKLGELMAIAQQDIRSLYSALAPGIRILGEAIVTMVAYTVIIFMQSWLIGIIFLIMIPFWFQSIKKYNEGLNPLAVNQQNYFRSLSSHVQENFTGSAVVRAFSQEQKEIELFKTKNNTYTKSWEERGKITAMYYPMLVSYFIMGILFLCSAYLVINPNIIIGDLEIKQDFGLEQFTVMIVLIIQFRSPTFIVRNVLEFWSLGLAGVKKIQSIITEAEEDVMGDNLLKPDIIGKIVFNDVDFKYDNSDNYVLKNISFHANPGDIIAIVGPTGSGKSTLLKLLTRLYDPTSGSIKVDEIDILQISPEHLRKSIAVVEQDIFLFSSTIRDNITYAVDSYSEDDLIRVSELAKVTEFVDQLADGYDTMIGERGVRLSGGQRQRIAMARALLVNPKILLLDDSTSAVDAKTEDEIVSAIHELMKGRTSFIITNRLNMIKKANHVLVFDKGKLDAVGNHSELLTQNKIYRRIFDPHMELPKQEEDQ